MSHEDDKTGILLPVPCMYKPCCLLSGPASAFFTGPAGTKQRNYCCWSRKSSLSSEKDLIFEYRERLPRRDDGHAIEGRRGQLCTKVTKL